MTHFNELSDLPDIINYDNTCEPTLEIIAKAYSARDKFFNKDFNDVFEYTTCKLGINPINFNKQIKNKLNLEIKDRINNYFSNNSEDKILDVNMEDYIKNELNSEIYINKLEQFNSLNEKFNINTKDQSNILYNFYISFSIEQLNYIGF